MKTTNKIQILGIVETTNLPKLPFIIEPVRGGFSSPALPYAEKDIDLNDLIPRPNATYIMRLIGNSMEETIPEGAILIVDTKTQPKSGDIVIANLNGEYNCKRYIKNRAGTFLQSDNPKNKKDDRTLCDGDELLIFGIVSSHIVEHKKCLR